jgi:hypothetical protein
MPTVAVRGKRANVDLTGIDPFLRKMMKPALILNSSLRFKRFIIALLLGFFVCAPCRPVFAHEPWVGMFFTPFANSGNSHKQFLTDFETLVKDLKAKGLNTIVFDANYRAFHFTSDERLKRFSYPKKGGFNASEARRMAAIARENGMRVMVCLQVLTHEVGHTFPCVYPEYMLPGKRWQNDAKYTGKVDYVVVNGVTYMCVKAHTASTANAPPNKNYWSSMCSAGTRDPFNKAGEAVVFRMIDELIEAFTVNGVKPEGFHIGSDELRNWYDDPEKETGKSSAQIFAMAVTNAYKHIKSKNPEMEVIMWGDMFDPKYNGAPKSARNSYARGTAGALDLIPKDIIIADWRYEANRLYSYDPVKGSFPSVGEFIDKGFRVWPTSWDDEKATAELVWTGNMEQTRTGKVVGHLYNTCRDEVVPELKLAFDSLNGQTSNSKLGGEYGKIAGAINGTVKLVGAKQCRGTVYHCGVYPNCEDLTKKNDFYGNEFRDFSCANNRSSYKTFKFPGDYVSYWKFEGDARDAAGRNNGTLANGAAISTDASRGRVVTFGGNNDHVRVKNAASLNMGTGSMSIGAWFKSTGSKDYQALLSRFLRKNYTLFLTPEGMIQFNTNGGEYYRQSAKGTNYLDNRWHHVAAVFDASVPTINIYVDGELSNGPMNFVSGGNDKSSTADLYMGSYDEKGAYAFHGSLDEVFLYKRALSAVEVKMLGAARKPGQKQER